MTPERGAFLLEIGTEEIPARMIRGALQALGDGLVETLDRSGLPCRDRRSFGTPRRLAILLQGVAERTPDQPVEIAGPPVKAAFDREGRPTRAGEGFARAQGVAVHDLLRLLTPRGECVGVRRTNPGRPAADVLREAVGSVLAALHFPKTMRWGSGEHRFVRPVHSVVALLDDAVIDFEFAGVRSGRETFGHRVAGRPRIPLARPAEYDAALRENGVIADPGERRALVARGLDAAARAAGGRLATPPGVAARPGEPDPELLDEVTDLVECPVVLTGAFDASFLALPAEILLTSMRHHQKYFALVDASGALLPRFLAVANVASDATGAIRRGHEWVLKARLSDARFFYEEDRRTPLLERGAALERVAFHEKLGSYALKTDRLVRLAGRIARAFEASGAGGEGAAAALAARLSKRDLVTQMVKEFPELEGIVGGLYAASEGHPEAVARAVYDHYLPRSPDGPMPRSAEGAILALADRLDTQAGLFLIGVAPTGSKDPYGLRRSVQGACRILVERRVGLSLRAVLQEAISGYADQSPSDGLQRETALAALLEFWTGRQEFLAHEAGLRPDSVRAALAAGADDPAEARRRMEAVDAFRSEPGFEDLAVAHKRIKNILEGQEERPLEGAALREPAERALLRRIEEARPAVEAARRRGDEAGALRTIAGLREPLDRFFTDVLVMAEDAALRAARFALLRSLADLILQVADLSEIASSDRPPSAKAASGAGGAGRVSVEEGR